jgi:hypothetical protein
MRSSMNFRSPRDFAITAVLVLALLAFLDSIFEYVWTGNGIHGSEGALLVVVSTLLMAIAAWLIMMGWARGWFRGLLEVLILLDFLGTAVAAYFLQSWILLGLMVLGFIAWVAHLVRPARSLSTSG